MYSLKHTKISYSEILVNIISITHNNNNSNNNYSNKMPIYKFNKIMIKITMKIKVFIMRRRNLQTLEVSCL